MPNFTRVGTAPYITLPSLDFDTYKFRQTKFSVHSATKTVPIIWDEAFSSKLVFHKHYEYFKDYLNSLPLGPGYIQTAILINLPAGKKIPSHVDKVQFFQKFHRIHVPIVTNEDCLFTVAEETIHMKQFEMWEIDNDTKFHSVTNGGLTDRIHLLIDFCPLKLRISTHNNLIRFNTFDKSSTVEHRGVGVYYGSFGDWVVSRSYDSEVLLNFKTGEKIQLPSTFTHDLCTFGDRVYIADCGGGGVVELNMNNLKNVVRHIKPFTVQDHINTVLCEEPGKIWCLLHSLGKSKLVQICTETGKTISTIKDVGEQSHGIVRWGDKFLILSSGTSELLWGSDVLWKDSSKTFLKGLCVYEDIAYFGIAPLTHRIDRGDKNLQCEIAAFDLISKKLMWRQRIETNGLLNSCVVA